MKKNKIIFWTINILFAGFMLMSSVPDVLLTPEAKDFMSKLGYPDYFTQFIGVMKILGIIAILIPGFRKIKEWAYAGLFFDLAGAIYSILFAMGLSPGIFVMLLPILFLFASYYYSQKLNY